MVATKPGPELIDPTGTTSGHVLTSTGGSTAPTFQQGGRIVQVVNTQTGSMATGTALWSDDNSIPQISEGTEFMTLAITPANSSNKLLIITDSNWGSSVATIYIMAAIFQDATTNALVTAQQVTHSGTNNHMHLSFSHYMTAGTTSSTTFRFRAAAHTGPTTITFNGVGGAQKGGGIMASSMTIMEIET